MARVWECGCACPSVEDVVGAGAMNMALECVTGERLEAWAPARKAPDGQHHAGAERSPARHGTAWYGQHAPHRRETPPRAPHPLKDCQWLHTSDGPFLVPLRRLRDRPSQQAEHAVLSRAPACPPPHTLPACATRTQRRSAGRPLPRPCMPAPPLRVHHTHSKRLSRSSSRSAAAASAVASSSSGRSGGRSAKS
eukprot:358949-Chlamydomonas_euryale.AAC.4